MRHCRQESKFGRCDRLKGHGDGIHAICVGGGSDPLSDRQVWFVWGRNAPSGYRVATLVDALTEWGPKRDGVLPQDSAEVVSTVARAMYPDLDQFGIDMRESAMAHATIAIAALGDAMTHHPRRPS